MVLGKLNIHTHKNILESYLSPHTKFNSKYIEDVNVRHESPRRSLREYLLNFGLDNDVLELTLKKTGNRRKGK